MILNIHGFSSSGRSEKSMILRDRFGDDVLSPTLSNVPKLAIDTLEQIIAFAQKSGKNVNLVGSSIGGYFSIYLANKYNLKAVLINPAIYPYKFTNFVGLANSAYDGSKFECTIEHLNNLKEYEVGDILNKDNFLVLLQKGDKLLDYKQAREKFANSRVIIEDGGSHGYDNFSEKLPIIEEFLG